MFLLSVRKVINIVIFVFNSSRRYREKLYGILDLLCNERYFMKLLRERNK